MPRDLALWNRIERRFDGPIPDEDADSANWGYGAHDPAERARALRLMWAAEVRRQIRLIRETRRVMGTDAHVQALLHELRALFLYFRGANRTCRHLRQREKAEGMTAPRGTPIPRRP